MASFACVHFLDQHWFCVTVVETQVACNISRAVTRFMVSSNCFPWMRFIHTHLSFPPGRTWRNRVMSSCTKERSRWASPSSAGKMEGSSSLKLQEGASHTRQDWSTGTNYWRYEPQSVSVFQMVYLCWPCPYCVVH